MAEGLALNEYQTEIQHESDIWFYLQQYIPPPDPIHSNSSIKVLTAVWTLNGWSYEMSSYQYNQQHFQRVDGLGLNVSHWKRIQGPSK